jgi:uncharacterized RDD family membrane protein YckC
MAGFGKRFLAQIIDNIIIWIVFFLVLIPFGGVLSFLGMSGGMRGDDLSGGEAAALAATGVSFIAVLLILVVAPVVYDALLTASPRQGTLGKSIMKIKVIKENGQALTTSEAFVRALVKYVTGQFCFLLFMVCLFNKEEQNLHDLAAKTFVIEE